jgi:hypothetical protein
MRTARAAARVAGRIADAEALWYDTSRWAGWVDGFAAVRSAEGEWPRVGATLVWDSRPGGRGRVREASVAYEARVGQTAEVEDAQLTGTQRVAFTAQGDEVEILVELAYRLKAGGPLMWVTDLLFIRRALRDSLRRTVLRFVRELAAERELAGG